MVSMAAVIAGMCIPATVPPAHSAAQQPVRLEYIAHAAFVIESPGGTRVAIDPYNGNTWLGYTFPEGLEADAVLVSHPHNDHDATYYFSDLTAVLRDPGEYRVGDVALRGIASEHAGANRFLDAGQTPFNTIWVVETGGLRIAHLGDNRYLNELELEAMGTVDVVLLNAGYFDAVNADLLAMLKGGTQARLLVPMHYQHPELSDLPGGLRPVSDYMEGHEPLPFEGHELELTDAGFDEWPEVIVLQPSPAVEPWSDALYDAWIAADEGAVLLAESEESRDQANAEESLWEGLFQFETAMDLAPWVLRFGYGAADALARLGEYNDAIETLDHAVALAPRADWTTRARAHLLLGQLYEEVERPDLAIEHYAYVVAQKHTHETGMRERAVARLAELR